MFFWEAISSMFVGEPNLLGVWISDYYRKYMLAVFIQFSACRIGGYENDITSVSGTYTSHFLGN
jgi:hypothetical protein